MPAMSLLALSDAATRGALVALLLLLGALLARDRNRFGGAPVSTVGATLAAGLVVQVVFGTPHVYTSVPLRWLALPIGVSVANSMLFWLFAKALFEDDFRPRTWHVALWGAVVAVGAAGAVFCGPDWARSDAPFDALVLLAVVKSWLPLFFGLLALWVAARQWQADLVEGRRRVRGFVVAAGVFDTVAMVAARMSTSQGHVAPLAAWLDVALVLVIVSVMAVHLLQLGDMGVLAGAAQATPGQEGDQVPAPTPDRPEREPGPTLALDRNGPAADSPADGALANALAQAMAVEHVFRDDSLSVAGLADHLRVPEYRLRRVINQQLGFRNFNAYVNGYRLAAARAALADPKRRDHAVLAIALEVGFGSIGPFNRAFKAEIGLTPSEFRRQSLSQLADS